MNQYEASRRIELKTRRLVQSGLVGTYRSAFRGSGLDFADIRPYTPGDDIRHINWPVTARAQRPFVKQFVAEQQLTLLLLVDVSGSLAFGSTQFKRELVTELTAVLATAAHLNHDQVGLLLFSDQIEALVKPGQGRNQIRRLIHTLLTVQPAGRETDLALGLQTAVRVLKQRGMVVLLSDFLAAPSGYRHWLTQLSQRHDVLAIRLTDPLEHAIPKVGLLALRDAETGQQRWVDTNDKRWRQAMTQHTAAHDTAVAHTLHQSGVDLLTLSTAEPYLPPLTAHLARRK